MFKTEVCCGCLADVIAAYKGGASRAEVCGSLFFGGLTPSLGYFMQAKKECPIELAVMIRPREGGFCYSEAEFSTMLCDAEIFVNHGADAIVFGCLNADGTLNIAQNQALCDIAKGKCQAVFHKAFDVCTQPMEQLLNQFIAMGISRVLTSGREKTALEGAENIKKLIAQADGKIEIMPGGGVRAENIRRLITQTGCNMAHTSALESAFDLSANNSAVSFTGNSAPAQGEYKLASEKIIAKFVGTVK